MFDVTKGEIIRERGFVTPRQRRLRLDIAKATIEYLAGLHGFSCQEVSEPEPDNMKIKIKISGEREEHPGEIIVGGTGWGRKFVE